MKLIFLLLRVALAVPCVAQDRGTPIFSDLFDTSATFAERWVPNDKRIKSEDGKIVLPGVGSLTMRGITPLEFYVEMDITLDVSPEPDQTKSDQGFCGFIIDGFRFQVLPSGKTWMIYKLKGYEKAHGKQVKIDGFELKKPVRLTLIRKVRNGTATYNFRANGKDAGSFVCDAPLSASSGESDSLKPLEIFSYKVNTTLDNFSISAIRRSDDDSPNVVINSSFEHEQDGFPLYFGRSGFNMEKAATIPYEEFLATWTLDTAEKHSGRQSLKAVFDESMDGQTIWAWGAGTVKDLAGVFSVWLKADQEDFPVWLSYGIRKEVKVGTSWKRYEVVNPKLPGAGVYSPVRISFNKVHGTLWIDDLQAEFPGTLDEAELQAGASFATPYKPSELDQQRFSLKEETPVRASDTTITKQPEASHPNNDLDTKKDKASGGHLTVSMLGRLNYYMNEKEALFRVTTTHADAGKLTAVLTVAGKTAKTPASARFNIAMPLKDVPDGTNSVALALMRDGRKVGETSGELVKRPFKEGAAQINHFTRSLMHEGKPVFQFAPFFVFAKHQSEDYVRGAVDWADRYGFRYLHILVENKAFDNGVLAISHAQKKGIKVMLWTKFSELTDEESDGLTKKLDFPNVISQMVLDEPELYMASDAARTFLRKMRPKYPYHPVQMNNTVMGIPNRYADLETDILMLDDYLTNVEKRTVASVVDASDIMWEAGRDEAKPCFYFVVGGNFPLHYREPSYAEQIAQTYGNIAAGCTGFSYFYGAPMTPGNWKAYIQLNREILSLNDILLSEEEIAPASSSADPKIVRNITRKHEDSIYLISSNIDRNAMDKVTFTLPAELPYADEVEVLFEKRSLPVKNGKFSDDFAGHARHVYKVTITD